MKSLNRGRNQEEHVDSEGSWAISYGDMITLLMSFFVLYFSIDHESVRRLKLQTSLVEELKKSGVKDSQPISRDVASVSSAASIHESVLEKVGARLIQDDENLIVEFNEVSFFDMGKIDLTKKGQEVLNEFVKSYLPFAGQHQIRIQAFTDTRKVRSDNPRFRDNLELSALRAVSSMRTLQKAGIPLNQMKIAGYGEMVETQERLAQLIKEKDPLKYTRKVVLVIEPLREGK